MQIEILNWSEFNPKRDQKTYTWLRLENNIPISKSLHGLTAEQKWAWICLLCEASKDNSAKIEFDIEWLSDTAKVKKSVINDMLEILNKKQVIRVSLHDGVVQCRDGEDPLHLRTNVRTYERTLMPDSPNPEKFDFESIYKKYSRKEGKAKGLKICQAQVKTREDYDLLSRAIDRYNEHNAKNATDPRFIKHFSTFMGSWRDWCDPETGTIQKVVSTEKKLISRLGKTNFENSEPEKITAGLAGIFETIKKRGA